MLQTRIAALWLFLVSYLTLHQVACGDVQGTVDSADSSGKAKGKSRPAEGNLAFIININSGEIPTFQRMFCRLWHPLNFYVLNMNGMAPEIEHKQFNDTVTSWGLDNVLVMSPPHPAAKYGFSFVEVYIRGMLLALKYNSKWTHVVPLVALEYPLLNALDLRRVAGALSDKDISILDARPLPEELKPRTSMLCKDPAVHSNTGTYEALANSVFGVDPTPPSDRLKCRRKASYMLQHHYPPYRGIWGSMIHRSAAQYVIEAPDGLPLRLQTAFSASFLPEEVYFQTLLCNSPHTAPHIVSLRQRFSRWSGDSFEPDYVYSDQIRKVAGLGFMFARRVADDDTTRSIDREICGSASKKLTPTFSKQQCSSCWMHSSGSTQAPRRNYEAVMRRITRAEQTNLGSCNPNITDVLLTDRIGEEIMIGADSAEAQVAWQKTEAIRKKSMEEQNRLESLVENRTLSRVAGSQSHTGPRPVINWGDTDEDDLHNVHEEKGNADEEEDEEEENDTAGG